MNTKDWYTVDNIDQIDSPALIIYKERVLENIRHAIDIVKDVARLRPHVKTNKMADVCKMMMEEGITKFKCATIAEAEMLGSIGAKDVLFAFQPVGPKIDRLLELVKRYPATKFSCLIDNSAAVEKISERFQSKKLKLKTYLDLNVGMNRTGIAVQKALSLYESAKKLPGIDIIGVHVYDGHITDADITVRQQRCDAVFREVLWLVDTISGIDGTQMKIVAGGSPTFMIHAQRTGVECSPGTFVFWDWSYKHTYPDDPFNYAALVATRIISVIDETRFCIDLGHKSVAAENPLPRVHFLNAPEETPVSHSEEHMVVKVPDITRYSIGDVLYGVPVHICPTVALYERASVVEQNKIVGEWKVTARDKKVNI
ncbi:MAG: D-TA family PLP-dependent enzyme [Ignavibacteriales bacterium]|nr:D-TA family PLP-dependent enzyme [Ignavibacteriales bacterium]